MVDFKSQVLRTLASQLQVGNTVELRGVPKALPTKLGVKALSGQGNDLGYGNIGRDRLGSPYNEVWRLPCNG